MGIGAYVQVDFHPHKNKKFLPERFEHSWRCFHKIPVEIPIVEFMKIFLKKFMAQTGFMYANNGGFLS